MLRLLLLGAAGLLEEGVVVSEWIVSDLGAGGVGAAGVASAAVAVDEATSS